MLKVFGLKISSSKNHQHIKQMTNINYNVVVVVILLFATIFHSLMWLFISNDNWHQQRDTQQHFVILTSIGGELVCAVGGRQRICIPENYQKYDLPIQTKPTFVTIGVDIKDIPKVSDKDFSITLNAYFNVKWRDPRLLVSKDYSKEGPLPDVRIINSINFNAFCDISSPFYQKTSV